MATRLDVEFHTHDNTLLRGWLYLASAGAPMPGIVMTHGFSATREMGLPGHAEALREAGFTVLLYDHRGLGTSDGLPRQLIDPFVQTRDMMDAIGWLSARPEVDAGRIGLWGTSYSGAEALILGALDERVRAVAAIVPFVGQPGAVPHDDAAGWQRLEQRVRSATIDPAAITGPRAVVPAPGGLPVSLMPDPHTTTWMLAEGGRTDGRWRNAVLSPVRPEGDVVFDPAPALPHLHSPVLLIAGAEDLVTPAADARAAALLAGSRVQLAVLPGQHCTFYAGEPLRTVVALVKEFFACHLQTRAT